MDTKQQYVNLIIVFWSQISSLRFPPYHGFSSTEPILTSLASLDFDALEKAFIHLSDVDISPEGFQMIFSQTAFVSRCCHNGGREKGPKSRI